MNFFCDLTFYVINIMTQKNTEDCLETGIIGADVCLTEGWDVNCQLMAVCNLIGK